MAGAFDRYVVSAFRGRSATSLADAQVDALRGLSAGVASHLREPLGIATVADLANHRFVRAAQAITNAAADPGHDRGPDAEWTAFFESAPLAVYQAHPRNFRLDFGPVWYRGRLDGTARVLIVGQDPAANELIGHRIFVGLSGQRVQGFLGKLGISRDYLMVNAFIYPVFGQFPQLARLSRDPQILGFRNALLDRIASENRLEAVIAVGSAARDAVQRWPNLGNTPFQHITHPSAPDHAQLLANWNAGVAALRSVVTPELGVAPDTTPYGADFIAADEVPIPRRDLPFGVPDWHGVGSHATRGKTDAGSTDNKLILWTAP